MLKGKMIIEMTDVHTGETEKVVEHNMITNALSEIFKPLGLAKDPSILHNTFAPYYQKLLGGILLVLISMGLTFIAGLIPSRYAANKDPVEALRTE